MTDRYELNSPRKGKDGKTFWTRVGTMFPARNGGGWAIKLDALPLPDERGEVWVRAFPPKEREDDTHAVERRTVSQARESFGGDVEVRERPRPSGLPEKPGATATRLDDEIPFAPEWR